MTCLADNLRQMRASRGISQLELGLRLGVSQRHVSFVELGRARPSRSLILSWARATEASSDERNAALVTAGFTPSMLEFASGNTRETSAFRSLCELLDAHDPYPGLIFDADWMIHATSEGAEWLGQFLIPAFLASTEETAPQMDMIAVIGEEGGLLTNVRNAAEIGFTTLKQLRAEQRTRASLRLRVDRLEASLIERFGPYRADDMHEAGETLRQLVADTRLGTLRFLMVQAVFGLPQNVTPASLRTELWFPMDEATRQIMMLRKAIS